MSKAVEHMPWFMFGGWQEIPSQGAALKGLEIQGDPQQPAHLELKQKEGERRGEGEEGENAEEKEKRWWAQKGIKQGSRKMQSDIHFCFLYCKSHDCHAWSQCKLSIASGGSEHSVTTNLTPVWDWESESCPHVQVCFVYSSWLWTCTGHSPNLEIDWGVLPTSTPFLPSDKRKETCWNQHGSPFVRRGLWWDDLGVEMGLAVL